jgi:hypothetical protein
MMTGDRGSDVSNLVTERKPSGASVGLLPSLRFRSVKDDSQRS